MILACFQWLHRLFYQYDRHLRTTFEESTMALLEKVSKRYPGPVKTLHLRCIYLPRIAIMEQSLVACNTEPGGLAVTNRII